MLKDSLFLTGIQIATGLMLLLYYTPSIDAAHESVQFIMGGVKFGWLIRSVHSWTANILVGVIFIHMFSTFFLKAYRPPRELTWITGFLLLVMVMAVLLFAIVGKPSLPYLVLSRIIGIPLIIGISYEVGIKWAGKHSNSFFPRILLWPGLQLQRLTTRQPTDDQLEVAAIALEEVMRMDAAEQAAAKAVPVVAAEAQA